MLEFPNFDQVKRMPYTYYKRDGNQFYFKNQYHEFDIVLEGKDLFDFIDQFDVGDEVRFFEED